MKIPKWDLAGNAATAMAAQASGPVQDLSPHANSLWEYELAADDSAAHQAEQAQLLPDSGEVVPVTITMTDCNSATGEASTDATLRDVASFIEVLLPEGLVVGPILTLDCTAMKQLLMC